MKKYAFFNSINISFVMSLASFLLLKYENFISASSKEKIFYQICSKPLEPPIIKIFLFLKYDKSLLKNLFISLTGIIFMSLRSYCMNASI